MSKIYNCIICNFSSKSKYNYDIHCKSIKHANNEKKIIKYLCEYCGKEFSQKKYLTYHLKTCKITSNKKQNINDIDTLNKIIITDKDLQINYLKKIIEQNIRDKEEYIKSKENEINFLKSQISQLYSNSVKSQISAFKYAVIHFTNAPLLNDFTNFDSLKTEDNTVLDIILHKSEKNILHEYIGDIIINNYKKKNIATQSMWNTDVARLSYIIRGKMDLKKPDIIENCEWKIDKNAEIIKKSIILPILKYLRKISTDAAKEKFKEYNNNNENNTERDDIILSLFNKKNAQLQQELENISNISQNIIKHISPHFYMNEKTLVLA